MKPPLVLALNRITQPLALPRARAALASFPPFPHEEEELRVHGPSGVNAPNKGEVATTVAFSSDRPKKVSRASDSRPLNPGLFCSMVSLPSGWFCTLSSPEYRARTLAWTETVKTS